MSALLYSIWLLFLAFMVFVLGASLYFRKNIKDRIFECESCGTIQSSTEYNIRTNCVQCGRKLTKEIKGGD